MNGWGVVTLLGCVWLGVLLGKDTRGSSTVGCLVGIEASLDDLVEIHDKRNSLLERSLETTVDKVTVAKGQLKAWENELTLRELELADVELTA